MARSTVEEPQGDGVTADATTEPELVEQPALVGAAGPRKFVRVKNKETGHEVTKLASVVARNPGRYSVLEDKPATSYQGIPLGPKPRRELGE